MRSIVYVGSTLSIPLELGCAVGTNKSALKAVTNIPSSKTSNPPFISDRYEKCFEDSLLYEQFTIKNAQYAELVSQVQEEEGVETSSEVVE